MLPVVDGMDDEMGKKVLSFTSYDMDPNIEQKFIAAYDAHTDAIFRYCFWKTNDRELAKDLMQQAFAKTWAYMQENDNEKAGGKDIGNIRAFLYKIAGNLIIDWYRKRKEQSLDALQDDGFDPADAPNDIDGSQSMVPHTDRLAEIQWMMQALDKLDPADKDLILLNYMNGIPYSEIAEAYGEKPTTISVRIHRAMKRLKKILHADLTIQDDEMKF